MRSTSHELTYLYASYELISKGSSKQTSLSQNLGTSAILSWAAGNVSSILGDSLDENNGLGDELLESDFVWQRISLVLKSRLCNVASKPKLGL